MLKKLFFLSLSLSLTLSPYACSQQAQNTNQHIIEQVKILSEELEKLSPEEKNALQQAALETFDQLSEEQKALLSDTTKGLFVAALATIGVATLINPLGPAVIAGTALATAPLLILCGLFSIVATGGDVDTPFKIARKICYPDFKNLRD